MPHDPTLKRDPTLYRPNVGIAIFNKMGKIWLGQRFGETAKTAWQCPQGGIDDGETPEQAAIRELFEETGLRAKKMDYLGQIEPWLFYDFPPEATNKNGLKWGYKGQRQKWFAYRYHGDGSHVDLQAHGPQEFSDWKWEILENITQSIVPFKFEIYERLILEFAAFARPSP